MLHTKTIDQLVLELKIFKGFYDIYGCGGHIGHVNYTVLTYFRSLYAQVALNGIRLQLAQWVSRRCLKTVIL